MSSDFEFVVFIENEKKVYSKYFNVVKLLSVL